MIGVAVALAHRKSQCPALDLLTIADVALPMICTNTSTNTSTTTSTTTTHRASLRTHPWPLPDPASTSSAGSIPPRRGATRSPRNSATTASRASVWQFELPRPNARTAIGLLGLGELGSAVACALAADGFEMHGWSRTPRDLPGVRCHAGAEGITQMAGAVDMLINLLPLTAETHGILSSELFDRLTPGSFVINMGRGGHLVEADLLSALAQGRIEAATLDVAAVEPLPAGHPFWAHPGILITPHVAGITSANTAAVQIAENVRRAMRGEALLNQVDLERGY